MSADDEVRPDISIRALLAWWGGFVAGPIAGAAVYLSAPRGSLERSHGAVAAVMWIVVFSLWIPFTVWVILLGNTDPGVLLYALPVVLTLCLAGCINATLQIRRGRSPLGRTLPPATWTS